ncbi:MAG: T9SS type A sorting domain-containing protein [Ignavibacteriaceae bacterium]|nr:T9SS type A sorting domain-containing protein [Ignavibacteriaceae bacterium]
MKTAIYNIGGDPNLREPATIFEARNYINGLNRIGAVIDPCTWPYGEVRGGVPCNQVNPYFWCSGDPVANIGWISLYDGDVRGNGAAGPFTLVKDQEVEVLIGYEVDRSTTPLGGIIAVKSISDAVQIFYENNFGYPIVSVEDESQVVSSFTLEQNYPNPFNPTTNIGFRIADFGFVSLKVYDILGNEIATLVNEEFSPGEYEVEFSAKSGFTSGGNAYSLSSGIYFYTLSAGEFIQTKKMILLR